MSQLVESKSTKCPPLIIFLYSNIKYIKLGVTRSASSSVGGASVIVDSKVPDYAALAN